MRRSSACQVILSSMAACVLLLPACLSALMIVFFSRISKSNILSSPLQVWHPEAVRKLKPLKCFSFSLSSSQAIIARSKIFFSSRTFPLKGCCISLSITAVSIPDMAFPVFWAKCLVKCSTRMGISSFLSRRGGI